MVCSREELASSWVLDGNLQHPTSLQRPLVVDEQLFGSTCSKLSEDLLQPVADHQPAQSTELNLVCGDHWLEFKAQLREMTCMVVSLIVQESLQLTRHRSCGGQGKQRCPHQPQLPGRLRTCSYDASL